MPLRDQDFHLFLSDFAIKLQIHELVWNLVNFRTHAAVQEKPAIQLKSIRFVGNNILFNQLNHNMTILRRDLVVSTKYFTTKFRPIEYFLHPFISFKHRRTVVCLSVESEGTPHRMSTTCQ